MDHGDCLVMSSRLLDSQQRRCDRQCISLKPLDSRLTDQTVVCVCCRELMGMHWRLPCGWPTHRRCCISSAVMWTLRRWAWMLRMYWQSACSMHSCCLLTRCRTVFIRRCRHSSVLALMWTVLPVSICVICRILHSYKSTEKLSACNVGRVMAGGMALW